jgi:hypothetical protein
VPRKRFGIGGLWETYGADEAWQRLVEIAKHLLDGIAEG